MVVYVREVKGPDSLALLWHVCLAKDKFLSGSLPEQLSSAPLPSPSCVLWIPLLHAAVFSGPSKQSSGRGFLKREMEQISQNLCNLAAP